MIITSTIRNYLLLILLFVTTTNTYAQCTTEIRSIRDTIACGESLFLENIIFANSPTSDNFSGSTLGGLWDPPGGVTSGWTLTSPCGLTPTGQNLWFAQNSAIPREAATVNIDASCGGTVCFDFRMETQSAPPCDGPDAPGEDILLQFKNNSTGGAWTTFHTFVAGTFSATNWNNYCFPIPNAATLGGSPNQVQFRWIQFSASSPIYDLWGIDNVNITLNPPCGIPYNTTFFGPNVPLGYAFDTITVTPYTDSAIYYVNATNGTNNCFDSITIYVEQPSIVSQLLPSGCAGSDTLDVEATITANCYYTLQLLNSGSEPGWQVPTTSPQIYHNLDVNINGSLLSNFTMLNGATGSSIDFLIPVTDGDLLETYFTALGSASNECMFKIYDSQGVIANTGGGSTVTASTPFGATPLAHYYNNQLQFNVINGGSGYNSPPYSAINPAPTVTITGGGCIVDSIWVNGVTWNPPPLGGVITNIDYSTITGCTSAPTVTITGGGGSGAVVTATLIDDAVHVSCPATASYSYSWNNLTSGGTVGLSPSSNIQNPIATVSVPTDFQVTAYDPLHPLCIAIDTVSVAPNANPITATMSGNDTICQGDSIQLDFTLSGTAPFTLELYENGILNTYELNAAGLNITPPIAIPEPLKFLPLFNTTYYVGAIFDDSGCPGSVTNPALDVVLNQIPFAGNDPLSTIEYCQGDAQEDLSTLLLGAMLSPGGVWTDWMGNPVWNGLNFFFNPTNPAGATGIGTSSDTTYTYTYTVTSPPCPMDDANITINVINSAIAGVLPDTVHMCRDGSTLILSSLFTTLPNPMVYDWTNITSGTPNTVNLSGPNNEEFTPSTSGTFKFRNTVPTSNPALCSDAVADINVVVHDLPTVNISSVDPDHTICVGDGDVLTFTLTGTAPYTVSYNIQDITGSLTPANVILNSAGNDNITGNPISVSPVITSTYTTTNIIDAMGCASTGGSSVTINVTQTPRAGNNNTLTLCADDMSNNPLQDLLGAVYDNTGSWVDPLNNPILPSSSTFDFNLTSHNPGEYTYVVMASPCPNDSSIITVDTVRPANSGIANPEGICINNYSIASPYVLSNLLTNADAGGFWTDITSGGILIPAGTIDPNTYASPTTIQTITFEYEVAGTSPCPNDITQIDLEIYPEPVVNSFTSNVPVIAQGSPVTITTEMSIGSPPFTINFEDDFTPPNTYTTTINPPLMIGSTVTTGGPNVIPVTTYNMTSVTDGNQCTTTTFPLAIPVIVDPYPVIQDFNTSTPEICADGNAFIEMTLTQGEAPITVNYEINSVPFSYILGVVGQPTPIFSGLIPISLTNLVIGDNLINITSVTDNSNVPTPSDSIPLPINITVNPLPDVTLSTSTPEICFKDAAELDFGFLVGSSPFTINYQINFINQPPLQISGTGNQTYTITPDPSVGQHIYTVTQVIDDNGCKYPGILPSVDIEVYANPDLDLVISGPNPICFGKSSSLFFPVILGKAPFDLDYTINGFATSAQIDATGNILATGSPLPITPDSTTTYSISYIKDANNCENTSVNVNKTLIVHELPFVDITGTTEICVEELTKLYFDFTSGLSPWQVYYNINGFMDVTPLMNNPYDSLYISPTSSIDYVYDSIVDANGCSQALSEIVAITVNTLPEATISGGGYICDDGSTTEVIITTSAGTPTYNIEYSVGFENFLLTDVGLQHTISTNTSGTYTLNQVTDSKGCVAKLISGNPIVGVNPMPKAEFIAYPQPTDINNPVIFFVDQSTGHSYGVWSFGDEDSLTTNFDKIRHIYSDTGSYIVDLIIASDSGCTTVKSQTIIINQAFTIYIPNSFTPNNDLKNDYFLPIVNGVQEYNLSIYDRLGKRIFETSDFSNKYTYEGTPGAWDGKTKSGDFAPAGGYVYSIIVIDINGKERTFEGSITLIR